MFNFTSPPGGAQPGRISLAVLDGLLDLLVQKDVIGLGEATDMLQSVATKLRSTRKQLDIECADLLRDAILKKGG